MPTNLFLKLENPLFLFLASSNQIISQTEMFISGFGCSTICVQGTSVLNDISEHYLNGIILAQ